MHINRKEKALIVCLVCTQRVLQLQEKTSQKKNITIVLLLFHSFALTHFGVANCSQLANFEFGKQIPKKFKLHTLSLSLLHSFSHSHTHTHIANKLKTRVFLVINKKHFRV